MSRRRLRTKIAACSALPLLLVGAGTACSTEDAAGPPADLQPPNQLEKSASLIRPAIVSLQMHMTGYVFDEQGNIFNQGNPYEMDGTCSGFVVNPDGYVATAGHCVDAGPEGFRNEFIEAAALEAHANRPSVSVEEFYNFGVLNWRVEGFTAGSPLDVQIGVYPGGDPKSDPLPARVVDFRSLGQGDVALLKVEANDLPSAVLATDTDVRIGDQVMAVGYPAATDLVTDQSAEPSNKEGAISSKKTQGSVPVYEISAAVSPGMSGGPTVATDGRVLGVNSFRIVGESQPFNFIAPSAGLTELLRRNGVQSALGPVDTTYRDGLTAFYDGRYTAAIANFDKVIALAPQHAKAVEMKTRATQLNEKYGDWGLPTSDERIWYVIGGGIAASLIVIGAALLILLRRRRRTIATPVDSATLSGTETGAPMPAAAEPLTILVGHGAEAGAPVATLDPPEVGAGHCAGCGGKARSGDRFCRGCGQPL